MFNPFFRVVIFIRRERPYSSLPKAIAENTCLYFRFGENNRSHKKKERQEIDAKIRDSTQK